MSYIEVTGKTEEEAVRKALTQLVWSGTTYLWRSWSVPRAAFWASAVRPPVSV